LTFFINISGTKFTQVHFAWRCSIPHNSSDVSIEPCVGGKIILEWILGRK
jgi:hypothetical protein